MNTFAMPSTTSTNPHTVACVDGSHEHLQSEALHDVLQCSLCTHFELALCLCSRHETLAPVWIYIHLGTVGSKEKCGPISEIATSEGWLARANASSRLTDSRSTSSHIVQEGG